MAVFEDLRLDRWKLYQSPREVPVIGEGRIHKYVIIP